MFTDSTNIIEHLLYAQYWSRNQSYRCEKEKTFLLSHNAHSNEGERQ